MCMYDIVTASFYILKSHSFLTLTAPSSKLVMKIEHVLTVTHYFYFLTSGKKPTL